MRLTSVTLKNFRSFRDSVSIPRIAGINVFVGRNNSGKSNLVEALRYISTLAQQRAEFRPYSEMVFDRDENRSIQCDLVLQLDDSERGDLLSKWFKHDIPPKVLESRFLQEVTYTVEWASWGIKKEQLKISNFVDGELLVHEIEGERNNFSRRYANLEEVLPSLVPADRAFGFSNISLELGGPISSSGSLGFAPLGFGVGEISYLVRRFMGTWIWLSPLRMAQFRMSAQEASRLDASGSNLTQVLNTMQTNNPDRFVLLKNEVVKILPEVERLLAPPVGGKVTLMSQELGLKNRVDLGNMSFGAMEILILVTCLFTAPSGSIVLIEEPEIHLHAGARRRLLQFMQRCSDDKQIVVTTHSPIFSNLAENTELYLVTKREGVSTLRRITESSELKSVKMELEHRNIDLYGYEGVVFIEGDSEEIALPIIAEALRYDLVSKGIRLVNVEGSGKFKKMAEYLRYVQGSGVKPFVIADGHMEVSQKVDGWVREGLINQDSVFVWPLEFEDCFSSKTLLKALKKTTPDLQIGERDVLEKPRDKPVVRVIERLLYEQNLPGLDKTELAENLALELKKEIETDASHTRTLLEEAVTRIVEIIDSAA